MEDIIIRTEKNKVFKILANYGPAGLRTMLNLKEEIFDENKKYSFMCELCNEILGDSKLRKKLKKTQKRY